MENNYEDAKMMREIKKKTGIDPLDYKSFDDYFNAVEKEFKSRKGVVA